MVTCLTVPDSPELMTGLTGETDVVSVSTPSSPYSRTSMTLRSITKTRALCLLVFGETKRVLLKNPQAYAINHLLEAMPVEIFNFENSLRKRQAD